MRPAIIVLILSPFVFIKDAEAVSRALRKACADDYMAYCNVYELGSPELKACMRKVQDKLSPGCVREIGRSGEATPEEIKRYKKRHRKRR